MCKPLRPGICLSTASMRALEHLLPRSDLPASLQTKNRETWRRRPSTMFTDLTRHPGASDGYSDIEYRSKLSLPKGITNRYHSIKHRFHLSNHLELFNIIRRRWESLYTPSFPISGHHTTSHPTSKPHSIPEFIHKSPMKLRNLPHPLRPRRQKGSPEMQRPLFLSEATAWYDAYACCI